MARADKIYNTEQEKDTRFTDAKAVRGNQQLLMDQIEIETVNIKTLNSLKKDQLNRVLLSIGFEKAELSRSVWIKRCGSCILYLRFPSNLARCDAIFTLYKSIESGYSQCHATGNRKKASGGWYVCAHLEKHCTFKNTGCLKTNNFFEILTPKVWLPILLFYNQNFGCQYLGLQLSFRNVLLLDTLYIFKGTTKAACMELSQHLRCFSCLSQSGMWWISN